MSTTIYQVHEDYEDMIIASYFHKSDAEAKIQSLKQQDKIKETEFNKCQNCPLYYLNSNNINIKDIKKEYCDRFELSEDDDEDDKYCVNEIVDIMGFDDIPDYRIEEEEVD